MTIVLPARTGDESMLRSGCVSSAADQTTSPVSRLSAWSWPLLSGTYTRSRVTSGEGRIAEPSCRLQSSVPSLARRAWTTPLQSPKYTTPLTTAGVLVTAERPSTRQRGARRSTVSAEMLRSSLFARVFRSSWLNTGHSKGGRAHVIPSSSRTPARTPAIFVIAIVFMIFVPLVDGVHPTEPGEPDGGRARDVAGRGARGDRATDRLRCIHGSARSRLASTDRGAGEMIRQLLLGHPERNQELLAEDLTRGGRPPASRGCSHRGSSVPDVDLGRAIGPAEDKSIVIRRSTRGSKSALRGPDLSAISGRRARPNIPWVHTTSCGWFDKPSARNTMPCTIGHGSGACRARTGGFGPSLRPDEFGLPS